MNAAADSATEIARTWPGYAWAAAGATVCTAIGLAMESHFDPVNIAMVYFLAVVVVALRCSRGAAIASALLSVAAFDFCFVPPKMTFAVDDPQYLLTFTILLAVAVVISELTGRVREQARTRAELEIAAETERIRSTLLASISHDLRTPLAVMSGASSSLAEADARLAPEERRALAQSVYQQSQALSEHVAKLLEMTRLETGTLSPDRDWNALGDIAGAVLGRLRERLEKHRVVVDLPADLPLVRVDAPLIAQVLGNLLENAAQYAAPGTVVRLRAEAREAEIIASVEDLGTGLPAGDLERLFAKFYRGSAEGAVAGTGLGLSICRAIVHLHGGKIWAERLPGGGTAFRFSLPREAAPEVPAEAA